MVVPRRVEHGLRTFAGASVYCVAVLGALVCDSIVFRGWTVDFAVRALSPWLIGLLALVCLLSGWGMWRFDTFSNSRGEERVRAYDLKPDVISALLLTAYVSGDVRVTEFALRASCFLLWLLAANVVIWFVLFRWRKAMASRPLMDRMSQF